ncbi:Diacylglycerol kinase family enzyme [Saccharicrinis carchari]|uniref:Diacylglycerol kinase family enzyme n=1 Tax=Saccharicrinis carchari TaxID=1168039 RepID=A0A521CFS5_SACCC|nr:diacylglycerol kinase family protein [Saccharicrinis carchari]SMO58297.1 Diacylglycerol kinase family enzyme [Saccharicrinis carchari]
MQQKQKIIFVINPISGDLDKSLLEEEIRCFADSENFWFHIYRTTGTNDSIKISELIKTHTPDIVVAAGGDGTCNMVGQLLLNSSIRMGVLPSGSANGLAMELCIPAPIKKALQTIIHGSPKPIDVIRINKNYISLHLSDIGVNAKVVQRFQKDTVRGFWGYGKHLIAELMDAKPIKFSLILDGREISKSAYMIVLANASQYGTGANINPKGKPGDGVFEVVLIRAHSIGHLLRMIIPFFTKSIDQLDYIEVYSCKKAILKTNKNQVVQIDGEVIGSIKEVEAEIIEKAVQVMVPQYALTDNT